MNEGGGLCFKTFHLQHHQPEINKGYSVLLNVGVEHDDIVFRKCSVSDRAALSGSVNVCFVLDSNRNTLNWSEITD